MLRPHLAQRALTGHVGQVKSLLVVAPEGHLITADAAGTLRVWDLSTRTMKAMAKLQGPGRCASYSPDGQFIAVGLGAGGKTKGKASTQPKTPTSLKDNMFVGEFRHLRDPMIKPAQKYNILYSTLAPKLVQKVGLIESKV